MFIKKLIQKKLDEELEKNPRKEIILQEILKDRKGMCKEKAAILQIIYQKEGIPSRYIRGKATSNSGKRGRHAWLKINLGTDILVDPTLNRFNDYNASKKEWNYVEDENLIEIV